CKCGRDEFSHVTLPNDWMTLCALTDHAFAARPLHVPAYLTGATQEARGASAPGQATGPRGCYAELGRPSYSRHVFRDARVNVEIARLAVGNSIVAQQTLACETAALKQNDGGLIRDHDNRLNSAQLEFR